MESDVEVSLRGVVGRSISRSEVDDGYFDDLVRNRVLDLQGSRSAINLSGLGQLVESLTDDVNRVPSKKSHGLNPPKE